MLAPGASVTDACPRARGRPRWDLRSRVPTPLPVLAGQLTGTPPSLLRPSRARCERTLTPPNARVPDGPGVDPVPDEPGVDPPPGELPVAARFRAFGVGGADWTELAACRWCGSPVGG